MFSVKVENKQAMVKFGGAEGIPVFVRNELRRVLPDLTKRFGALVDSNLNEGLKTRRRLVVQKQLVENPTGVYGRVTTVAIAPPVMLPIWLEDGTAPHIIAARNAPVLSFFWDKVGKQVFFKQVMHPGFAGIQYTARAWDSMKDEIRNTIDRIVREAMGKR